MKQAGTERGSRGRQAAYTCDHPHCDVTWLSPPQWATAAKQAKCRQTFHSTWVPLSGLPGMGQFEQGGGWREGSPWGRMRAPGTFPF